MASAIAKSNIAYRSAGRGQKGNKVFQIDPLKSVAVVGKDAKNIEHIPKPYIGDKVFKEPGPWQRAFFGNSVITRKKKLFRLLWASFIVSFLIPHYRPEWKSYVKWDPKKHFPLPSKTKVPKKLVRKRQRSIKFRTQKNVPWYYSQKKHQWTCASKPTPRYVEHDHSMCKTIRLNVSGEIFEPQLRTLQRFPNTLLGNPDRLIQFYNPARDEYFFDRHRTCFEAIIYYYNTGGLLRRPQHAPLDVFLEEIKFFDLGDEAVTKLSTLEAEEILPENLLKRKLWLFLEHPQSSYQAQIFAYLGTLAVCLSIFQFCLETHPTFLEDDPNMLNLSDPFFFVETVCVMFFVFEYIMRLLTSPNLLKFIRGFSNFVDLLAVLPYFVNVSGDMVGGGIDKSKTVWLTVLRTVRLVRVFRIFKLSRHNKGLKILGKTLRASQGSLILLIFFLGMGVIIFSSVMFIVERSNPDSPFTSIPEGFWFSLVTMTTLGVGDYIPTTTLGKIVGSLCAITGVLTISLPVPVIVSHFTMFYNSAEMNNTRKAFEFCHVEHCPYTPGWYAKDGSVVNGNDRAHKRMSAGKKSPMARKQELLAQQGLVGDLQPDYSDSDFDQLKWNEEEES